MRVPAVLETISLSAPPDDVLDVAQALLRATSDLFCLAFGLLRPVAGQLAEPFLELARGLVDRTFGAFAGHDRMPPACAAICCAIEPYYISVLATVLRPVWVTVPALVPRIGRSLAVYAADVRGTDDQMIRSTKTTMTTTTIIPRIPMVQSFRGSAGRFA
jgi:hypothetical protein